MSRKDEPLKLIGMTKEETSLLFAAATDAIAAARQEPKETFRDQAINWGDLKVIGIREFSEVYPLTKSLPLVLRS